MRRREGLIARLHAEDTDCYRLFHGAVEGRPGLAVDRYGPVLLVQTWREPLADGELQKWTVLAESAVGASLPMVPYRRGRGRRPFAFFHDVEPVVATCMEHGIVFDARPVIEVGTPYFFSIFAQHGG